MRRFAARPPTGSSAPSFADAGIAVGFLAVMLGELLFDLGVDEPPPGAFVAAVTMAGALLFRRRFPVSSYAVGSMAVIVQALFLFVGGLYPYTNLAHIYSVGAFATRRRALLGPLIGFVGVTSYFSVARPGSPTLPVIVSFVWFLVWAAGYGLARSREAAEAARQIEAREATSEVRATIAREIHDLVGHTVNVMVMQAGAGRRILDQDTDRAREALTAVEETGRSALGQLDQLLGILRDGEPTDPAPQPGMDDLPQLCRRLAAAGLQVSHRREGPADQELPRTLDLSAFAIVQEALTNSLRHGRATHAEVTVRHSGDSLELEVTDDGRRSANGYAPGRGLLGITERAALFGGTVEHGPLPGGGFGVRATLPHR